MAGRLAAAGPLLPGTNLLVNSSALLAIDSVGGAGVLTRSGAGTFTLADAPFTGGPFSHMDTVGIAQVVATLDRLAQAHGERFAPPQLLRDMAAKGETFYGRAAAKQAA